MQRQISENVPIGQSVNSAKSTDAVKFSHYVANFKNGTKNIDTLQRLMKICVMDGDLIKYLDHKDHKGLVYNIKTRNVRVYSIYKAFQTLEYNVKLIANQYIN